MNEKLAEKLRKIEMKTDSIRKMLSQSDLSRGTEGETIDRQTFVFCSAGKDTILSLGESTVNIWLQKFPKSLRKTMPVTSLMREVAAPQVAESTGRTLGVESFHLNQLKRMGYLFKFRTGKKIYFKIPKTVQEKGQRSLRGGR